MVPFLNTIAGCGTGVGRVVEMSIRGVGFRVIVKSEVETVLVRVVDAVAPCLVPAGIEPTPRCVSDTVVDMDLQFGRVKQAVEARVVDEPVERSS